MPSGLGGPSDAVPFSIERLRSGSTVRLAVAGELDLATTPQLRSACEAERTGTAELIVLDLGHVTFMDSTGLHALLDAHHSCAERLRIILGRATARTIEITGMRSRLPIVEG